eukprot:TRINITY_DN9344_c0_g1_i3.p1 TRINITY_DN9344_c0_g1~~TRINITY_DN9344_c0_g1_i3.p1  ORF type:complete len:382 (+),score=46.08 TRINITY_DN9344_c0_g1_i3:115-1260(+)
MSIRIRVIRLSGTRKAESHLLTFKIGKKTQQEIVVINKEFTIETTNIESSYMSLELLYSSRLLGTWKIDLYFDNKVTTKSIEFRYDPLSTLFYELEFEYICSASKAPKNQNPTRLANINHTSNQTGQKKSFDATQEEERKFFYPSHSNPNRHLRNEEETYSKVNKTSDESHDTRKLDYYPDTLSGKKTKDLPKTIGSEHREQQGIKPSLSQDPSELLILISNLENRCKELEQTVSSNQITSPETTESKIRAYVEPKIKDLLENFERQLLLRDEMLHKKNDEIRRLQKEKDELQRELNEAKGTKSLDYLTQGEVKRTGADRIIQQSSQRENNRNLNDGWLISNGDRRYHRNGCEKILRDSFPITLEEARGMNLVACGVCHQS